MGVMPTVLASVMSANFLPDGSFRPKSPAYPPYTCICTSELGLDVIGIILIVLDEDILQFGGIDPLIDADRRPRNSDDRGYTLNLQALFDDFTAYKACGASYDELHDFDRL